MLKVILVDDEELALKRLELLMKEIETVQVVGSFMDGAKAIKGIDELQPDLVFLDIQLASMNGFEVISNITYKPQIIFVTAFDKYAVKAFEYYAVDFILKPYKDSRVFQAIERVGQERENIKSPPVNLKEVLDYIETLKERNTLKIPVKIGNKLQFIVVSNILYVQASGYYVEIFTKEKKYVLRQSIKSLIEELGKYSFCRIHRSTIVNTQFVDELIYSNYGEIDVKMVDKKQFRVSKSNKKTFLRALGI